MKRFVKIFFLATHITIQTIIPSVNSSISTFNEKEFEIENSINSYKKEYLINQTIKKLNDNQIKFVEFEFSDVFGNSKSYTVTTNQAESSFIEGINFDGSSILGYATTDKSDCLLIPDLSTFKIYPKELREEKTASVICDVYKSKNLPHSSCPRLILKEQLRKAEQKGFQFNTSAELEFFIIPESKKEDSLGYCDPLLLDNNSKMKLEILSILDHLAMNPEKVHHEVATNQHEITIRYCGALEMADKIIITKNIIRAIAKKYGCQATFMPKPFEKINGSGFHVHYSLYNTKTSQNSFFDATDANKLSTTAYQFISGNLNRVKELSALLNSTINSFKRLVKGYEAPVFDCFGKNNRSALIRIPLFDDENPNAARVEIRSPDAMSNPYLVFSALLKSGLEGMETENLSGIEIKQNIFELTPEELKILNIKRLPENLSDALDKFEKSSFAKDLLGKDLFDYFLKTKRAEVLEFNQAVTDWEITKYF